MLVILFRQKSVKGDLVIVRGQPDMENSLIAVALWPEVNEAQLRRVYKKIARSF